MTKRKGLIYPTPEEDAAINEGIAADPDTYELSDEQVEEMRPARDVLPELFKRPSDNRQEPPSDGTK